MAETKITDFSVAANADIDGAKVDLNTSEWAAAAAPAEAANEGRLYYDSAADKFKVSENAGGYTDLVVSSHAPIVSGPHAAGGAIVIVHNRGYNPMVQILEDATSTLLPDAAFPTAILNVVHTDANTVTVTVAAGGAWRALVL